MRLRIPGIVDLALVSERDAIRELVANPALDRQFVPKGPLINRLLLSRVCRALTVDGKSLAVDCATRRWRPLGRTGRFAAAAG